MPELPEVEVSCQGLRPHLEGNVLKEVITRRANLRLPIPQDLNERLQGHTLAQIRRRGKYLLFHWPQAEGWIILHLGMSGSLRLAPQNTPITPHDHVDLVFSNTVMRFRDPRRFGLITWQEGANPEVHPLLRTQGIEPLSEDFTAEWLTRRAQNRQQPIKQLLMDAHSLVGVGNIYAAESLFLAGISPLTPAGALNPAQLGILVEAVKHILASAIQAGGSSVRDYVHSDGGAGCFQLQCKVYGRAGAPCTHCGNTILHTRQAGRSSFYCPGCQT